MEMTRQDMRNRVDELLEELADVEKQQEDKTLPHSDQQLLDQAWEDLTDQIAYFQEIIEMGEELDQAVEDEIDWGGEEEPISTAAQKEPDDKKDCYETDFGVYYNAVDEV